MAKKEKGWERDEYTIVSSPDGRYEVRTDTFPNPASYLRVVDTSGKVEKETVYWNREEWQEDGETCECIGAVFAVIGQVARGAYKPV